MLNKKKTKLKSMPKLNQNKDIDENKSTYKQRDAKNMGKNIPSGHRFCECLSFMLSHPLETTS